MLNQEAGVKDARAKHSWLCTTRGGSRPAMKHMYPPWCFSLHHPKSEAELAKAESRTLWALHSLKVNILWFGGIEIPSALGNISF